ncbi:LAG1 longevity assurance-like 6 [Papilio xuthus]|uniref:LAG1 longevity assurance-like 6 n=1 Tax=Papilio xuthus TaxID=66420 RepID=A0A0N1INF7_PAPXU|nr:LAG1 longevity assurance-like 6 [Papilio xuthus]
MTERQVERWWRLRRSQDKPSTLVKFCENLWKFTFHSSNFVFGLCILWNKSWLWDIDHAYLGYPHQGVTDDVWWYYMISAAFYLSLTISQFWDVRRKDFWQMFLHHVATVSLISFSWVCNLHRIGTLVLLLHDAGDIFVEAVKASKYANYQKTCDTLFLGLIIVWIGTRIIIFPYHLLWSTWIRAPMLLPMFPAYYIFNSLLLLLLMLHVVWTYLILQMAYRTIQAGKSKIRARFKLSKGEKTVYAPFGKHLGIKDTRNRKAPNNPKLEAAYRASPKLKQVGLYTNSLLTHYYSIC